MIPCPSDATLRSLGTDAIADTRYAAVEEHVEDCPRCKAALERFLREWADSHVFLPNPKECPCIPGFEIQRELGRGAMGVVYQAWQPSLKRRVALKIVRSGPCSGSRERARWLREAQAFTCVRHPNIVPLYEAGEAGPWLYLVLEHVPGGTLKQRLDVPYAARDAALLLETLAQAVAAIHANGLAHLDLKPSNILLDGEPERPRELATPMLGDFGIAFRWNGSDPSLATESLSGPLGTPSYMPPEQVSGDRAAIGPAADIYGLGALLYHVLTGRPPFSAPSVIETLEQVRNQEPVPPRRLIAQIPRDLETITLKCLAKNLAGRYPSSRALADDLRCWLDGRPISARPVSPLERLWRWCRRRPVVAALAATLFFVLSTGFLAVLLLWRHAEGERRRAEDELELAERLLSEISVFSTLTSGSLKVLNGDDIIAVFERTRKHLLNQRTQRPDDLVTIYQLVTLDLHLADTFTAQGNPSQARTLLSECLENLDRSRERHPQDHTALYCRFSAHWQLAVVADQEGKSEECLDHFKRAVAHGQECLRFQPDSQLIKEVAYCRWSLAQSLRRHGDDESAKSVILANLRMLDEVPKDDRDPFIVIWRTLVRLDLHPFNAGYSPASTSEPDEAYPLSQLASSDADRLDAQSWAVLVARSLSLSPTTAEMPSKYLYDFICHLVERIASQRRLGRLDEARRSTDRMHAFARLLVAQSPRQSVAHLALCASFTQMAKNAWQTPDRAAVERNWRLALDEARRALVLDPQDARAASEVADLQRRLDLLLASKLAPQDYIGHQ